MLQILQKGFVLDICNISSYAYISICLWGLCGKLHLVLCLDQLDARALHFLDDLTYMRLVWKRLRKPTGNAVSPVLNTSGTKFGNGIQPLEDKQKHHLFHLLVPFSVSYGNEIVSFVRWFYKLLSHVSLLFLVQYFQTENPLPPLAERGLHRAILPHQPGAPGDRTLLIGMCKVLQSVYFFILFQLIKCVLNTLNHLAPRTNTYKMYHSMYRCIKVVPRPSEAFESSWWDKAYRPSRRKSRSDAAEKPRAGAEQSET